MGSEQQNDLGPGIDIGAVGAVTEDSPLVVSADALDREDPVVVFLHQGSHYALDLWCSHGMASLAHGWVEDGTVECPLHGAVFGLADGQPQCPPATEPVNTHAVTLAEGRLLLHLSPDLP